MAVEGSDLPDLLPHTVLERLVETLSHRTLELLHILCIFTVI